MSPERLFPIVNFGVLPFWLLLIVAPRWTWTQRIVHSVAVPLLLCIAYPVALFAAPFPDGASGMTLEGVQHMFDSPWLTLACWIHFVIGDLWVGAWIARDAQRSKFTHWFVAPLLVLTNQLMPIGLAIYLVARTWRTKSALLER